MAAQKYTRIHAGYAGVRSKYKATPEYCTWMGMKQRCTDPASVNYRWYGGRGISVCPEWLASFDAFVRDVGLRPEGKTLDRYPNNDGNYKRGNVRWATPSEQHSNCRAGVRPKSPISTSKFAGVSRSKCPEKQWQAKIAGTYIASFRDECDAATAYNFAAAERYGNEKARFNNCLCPACVATVLNS